MSYGRDPTLTWPLFVFVFVLIFIFDFVFIVIEPLSHPTARAPDYVTRLGTNDRMPHAISHPRQSRGCVPHPARAAYVAARRAGSLE